MGFLGSQEHQSNNTKIEESANPTFILGLFTLGKGRGQNAVINLQGMGMAMPKSKYCDWSTRFMKVILLGLSLVSTSLQYRRTETGLQHKLTAVQLIQAKCVHLKCMLVVSS
jgi:hypothetical protein